jgi:hypothetical protein
MGWGNFCIEIKQDTNLLLRHIVTAPDSTVTIWLQNIKNCGGVVHYLQLITPNIDVKKV